MLNFYKFDYMCYEYVCYEIKCDEKKIWNNECCVCKIEI